MMYEIKRTTKFKKDYKLAVKRGLDISKLKIVIQLLAEGKTL
ncbi:MAG: type II toxin-antitoxin system YafQ family toxin [Lachnospirales bacterium]